MCKFTLGKVLHIHRSLIGVEQLVSVWVPAKFPKAVAMQ
jgi:hypothetical protein